MAQIFGKASTSIFRVLLVGGVFGFFGFWGVVYAIYRSPYTTEQYIPREQQVPFSHQHHVSGLGIDCRYCHTTAEFSSTAGLPPTETCMTCHSQVWTEAPVLEPVRESWRTGRPLQWNRVHDLPDFVFFDHGIHVQKGIGCATCHGRVDQMPLTRKENTLWMKWCLDCHSNPEKKIRPKEEVFDMAYQPPPNQDQFGRELVSKYNVHTERLKDCSMCHR
jgi:hypothetical protein